MNVHFSFHDRLLRSIDPVLQHIVTIGMDGMECFPPAHHAETGTSRYIDFAHIHGLMATSGSDYHGTKDPEVIPGHNIFPADEKEKTVAVFKQHHILFPLCSNKHTIVSPSPPCHSCERLRSIPFLTHTPILLLQLCSDRVDRSFILVRIHNQGRRSVVLQLHIHVRLELAVEHLVRLVHSLHGVHKRSVEHASILGRHYSSIHTAWQYSNDGNRVSTFLHIIDEHEMYALQIRTE